MWAGKFSQSKPKLVSNKIKYCKLIAKMIIWCVYVIFQWATLTTKKPQVGEYSEDTLSYV